MQIAPQARRHRILYPETILFAIGVANARLESVTGARTAQVVAALGVLRVAFAFVTAGVPAIKAGFASAEWMRRNGKWQVRILNHGTEIELSGGIGVGLSSDLRKSLDATPEARSSI
jgi:hypothetical protein